MDTNINKVLSNKTITENTLTNRTDIISYFRTTNDVHIVSAMPIVESNKKESIEEIQGNCLRVVNKIPLAYDYIITIIQIFKAIAMRTGKNIANFIKPEGIYYYKCTLPYTLLKVYFNHCPEEKKRNLLRQLVNNFFQSRTLITTAPNRNGVRRQYIDYAFRIVPVKEISEDHKVKEKYFRIFFSKDIFQDLVEGNFGKNPYFTLPAYLYPRITKTDLGILRTYNPLYKAQYLGLSERYPKQMILPIDLERFKKIIFPEYIKENRGNLSATSFNVFMENLKKQAQSLKEIIKNHVIVSNFYPNEKKNKVIIFFTKED